VNNYFIDTSALFKRYIPEQGTDELDNILNQDGIFYISELTIIEVISNLKRKNEISGEINEELYEKIKSEFFNDIAEEKIRTARISSDTIIEAINIIDQNYVTPIDSLQLAAAVQIKSEWGNVVFICSDEKLGSLAEKHGLEVLVI
jgi:predicted nucleic acid-binding protein